MAPSVKRGFADTAAGQVHYRIACPSGAASARPLVMFHGSPSSSLSLVRLMTHLAQTRTVIAFDTMGQGDSCPPPSADITFEDFAKFYAEALASLGRELDCVDLFGTHTGARIVAEFAIIFQRPDREGHPRRDAERAERILAGIRRFARRQPVHRSGRHPVPEGVEQAARTRSSSFRPTGRTPRISSARSCPKLGISTSTRSRSSRALPRPTFHTSSPCSIRPSSVCPR